MNLPPPDEIQKDIDRLIRERNRCEENKLALEQGIQDLRAEQEELGRLVDNPGPYSIDALKANIARIDDDVVRIRGVIVREGDKVKQLNHMIADLEERKCRSETISRSTGLPTRES